MTDLLNDQFAFWVFLIPGFVLVWSFRYFTDSKKTGEFEFLGLSLICGFLNLLLYDRLINWGFFKAIPDGAPIYVAGFVLCMVSSLAGLVCAQISKWFWFRKIVDFLKSDWSKKKIG